MIIFVVQNFLHRLTESPRDFLCIQTIVNVLYFGLFFLGIVFSVLNNTKLLLLKTWVFPDLCYLVRIF